MSPGVKRTSFTPIARKEVTAPSPNDPFGTEIVEAIKFRIIDEALKLEPIDWAGRFKALISAGRAIPTPRSANATSPSLPFESLAGAYHDAGYGTVDLCLISPASTSSSPSESCRKLLEEIPSTLPGVFDPEIPTLLARWNGFGVTHVSLTHFEHNLFNITGLASIPTRNSSDKPYWVTIESDPSPQAEFSFDGIPGVGFRGGIWGAGAGVPSPQGETVKDRAEAWFEKVDEA